MPSGLHPPSRHVTRWALPAILLLLALGLGLVLADDYGSSWDEQVNFRAGGDALGTYLSEQRYLSYLHNGGATLAHHGPSYFMVYWLVSKGLEAVVGSWDLAAARHFTNYLTFLLAIGCMYWLGNRILPRRTAWVVPALFASQPLLFGHAFINQKDMPFLAFFLACVVAGMAFVDRLRANDQSGDASASGPGLMRTFRDDWLGAFWPSRLLLAAVVVVPLLVFLDFFWRGNLLAYLHSIVASAYAGEAWGPITAAFRIVAEDAYKTSVGEYQFKVTWAFWIARMAFLLLLIGAAVWLGGKAVPNTARVVSARCRRLIVQMILLGILLGFTISIRPIGAFAGVLVVLYWVLRLRGRGLALFVPYWLAAAVAMYLTWPYIWQDPFASVWSSIRYTAGFGSLMVLFRGMHTSASELPWDYFPTLAGGQLTEPSVVLFTIGLPILAWGLYKRVASSPVYVVLLVWLTLPVLALVFLGVEIYNGIRQMLFLMPPIVLVGGVGLGAILRRIGSAPLRIMVVFLAVLPGLLGMRSMHPYEYAYYNQFLKGADGAAGQFELDYWCTSLRESMEYVNAHAEPEAVVVAWGPYWAAEEFARPDLNVRPRSTKVPDFIITCSWGLESPLSSDEFTRVYDVRRDSAILGSVFEHR